MIQETNNRYHSIFQARVAAGSFDYNQDHAQKAAENTAFSLEKALNNVSPDTINQRIKQFIRQYTADPSLPPDIFLSYSGAEMTSAFLVYKVIA